MTVGRREFLLSVAGSLAVARVASAQGSANTMDMDMSAATYKPVRLSPKPNATPLLSAAQRDDLEHHIHCQCGCMLDIYTCRTTDFSCPVSPSMHVDVMGLVAGGYGEQEILAAFRKVYGERVLMAPAKEGFNWLGYLTPFVILGAGSVLVLALLKHWSRPEVAVQMPELKVQGTPEELERLREAMRNDA
jgi:cytochrome c-type biogenesis protein CcmH